MFKFYTLSTTLQKYPNSRLTELVGAQTEVFIDRNPKYFESILNYYRTGDIDSSCFDKNAKREWEYFSSINKWKRLARSMAKRII